MIEGRPAAGTEDRLAAGDLDLPPAVRCHAKAETGSTNADALALAAEGAPHLTLIVADRQTAGRGRMGRSWESPPGNLSWSLLLRPRPDWPRRSDLAILTGLSVHDALAATTGAPAAFCLKWPNDVLAQLDDGGRAKICGILIEASDVAIVVGIGVNVAFAPAGPTRYAATSLCDLGWTEISARTVAEQLTQSFVRRLEQWVEGGLGALRKDYVAAMSGIGEPISVDVGGEERLEGTFSGIAEDGRLRLKRSDGRETLLAAGDVFTGLDISASGRSSSAS